ncbi:MAG TPA: hypothetical protein VIG76_03225 [Amnibacterium sp.]|jgi:hypothetical protein|uniref:hypothetical protein n=1 Tax=Amnibacterium sp. TaxID=1872496 RepID=UPI002F9483EC
MDGRRRRDLKETFDLGLGFIGFFAVAFVAITLYLEITKRDALISALTALVLLLFELGLWLLRRSVLNRPDRPDGS